LPNALGSGSVPPQLTPYAYVSPAMANPHEGGAHPGAVAQPFEDGTLDPAGSDHPDCIRFIGDPALEDRLAANPYKDCC
jgi:hypothetical protein